ncbi:MAG TPA: MFS transporter [Candidatus Limnocylindria bacterium]|nr:MFS transporter [Candidatus Limnocylindria bacterium]
MTAATRASDRPLALFVAFGFALSLGIATVAVPLLVLGSGFDAAVVGFLVAVSAATQLATRFALPWLLGRLPDRLLISVAGTFMFAGFVLFASSALLPAFVAAQMAQGAARAIFWTSSQTHAIRSGGSPVRRLVDLNLAGNAGTLTGPVLAGVLAGVGFTVPMLVAGVAVGLSAAGAVAMHRLPPYDRRRSAGSWQLMRRKGVDLALWTNVAGGVWWSIIGSYVPVILLGAGIVPALVGLLVTISEGSGAAALLLLRRLRSDLVPRVLRTAAIVEMAMLVGIAFAPPLFAAYVTLLILGGVAAGCVTSLGPALVALAATEHEQADGIALSGVFRSTAQLAAPALVGALLAVVSIPVAVAGIAVAIALPGAVLGRRPSTRERPATSVAP